MIITDVRALDRGFNEALVDPAASFARDYPDFGAPVIGDLPQGPSVLVAALAADHPYVIHTPSGDVRFHDRDLAVEFLCHVVESGEYRLGKELFYTIAGH